MNIDNLENSLGHVDVDIKKVISELLTLTIYNTSLLRIILSNQGKILNQINPDVDEEQFEKDCIEAAIKEADLTNLSIVSKLTK
jgi:hypothetical protein